MDKIKIEKIKAFGKHGCQPEEKVTEQVFEVDIELSLDLKPSGKTDDLSLSANYVLPTQIALDVIRGEHKDLIESLAYDISQKCLIALENVQKIKTTVSKPNAPIKADFENVSVCISLKR